MNAIRRLAAVSLATACIAVTACAKRDAAVAATPTAADAQHFLQNVNDTMKRLQVEQNQAGWVQQNFITDDTEALEARVNQRVTDAIATFAKDAAKFDHV